MILQTVPSSWTRSLIYPVPKKGNLSVISNYRPISLIEVLRKIFEMCLLGHLKAPSRYRLSRVGFVKVALATTKSNPFSFSSAKSVPGLVVYLILAFWTSRRHTTRSPVGNSDGVASTSALTPLFSALFKSCSITTLRSWR